MTYTDAQIITALDAAPEAVQKAASSLDTIDLITSFIDTYGLHIDTAGKIVEMNRNLLLGLTSPAEFLGELVLAGIDASTARKIIGELNEKIFVPVQKQMRESGPARAPMTASGPIAQPEEGVVMPQSPARTAPAPANLPGAEELLPASDPALSALLATPPPPPAPTFVPPPRQTLPQAPARAPMPPAPTPPVALPPAPRPAAPTLPPIYSVESNMPAMPQTKLGVPPQTSVMWQTPVPPAWQGKQVQSAPAIPLMTNPPEKPSPRTMEGDMQLAAQRASQPPQAIQAPQPSFQPVQTPAPAPTPVPDAPRVFATSSSIPSTVHTPPPPARQQESYVPPPRTVSVAPVRIGAGDPYRETIDASEL